MWRIIIASLLYVYVVESRPMLEPLDAQFWPHQQVFQQRNPQIDEQAPPSNFADMDYELATLPRLASDKRALTMLARWGSISDLGKNRTPIRSSFRITPNNALNPQTRTRIEGQPLRWG